MRNILPRAAAFTIQLLLMLAVKHFAGFEYAVLFGIASIGADVWWYGRAAGGAR